MGVQACRLPALKRLKSSKGLKPLKLQKVLGTPNRAGKSYPKATSMASSQRSSLPFARRYTLQTLQTLKHPLGMPNPAANRHPKATSMASYGRLERFKGLKPLKLCKSFSERRTAQAKATPRPHPWLLLSGPACRSQGVTRFKPFKRLNILLACLILQPTGTPRRHQWLLMGVQEPPSFRCHRCQTPTSCAFRFSETPSRCLAKKRGSAAPGR